jgi:hypothetical protein
MTSVDPNTPVRFKIELEFDYADFVIPAGKPKSMVNAMQREQAQWALEDALKLGGFNPSVINIYKVRHG